METELEQPFNVCILRYFEESIYLEILLSWKYLAQLHRKEEAFGGFVDSVLKATPVKYRKLLLKLKYIRI
jgi:hypothetical protein